MGKILERIVALERPSGLYHRRAASPRSLVLIESLAFTPFLTSISLPIGARWRTERPNLTNLPLTQSSAGPAAPALAQCTADVNGFMEVEVNAPSTPMRGDSGGVRTPDGNSYFAVYLNQPPDPCAIVYAGKMEGTSVVPAQTESTVLDKLASPDPPERLRQMEDTNAGNQ